jgi:hypothetical protein
MFPVVVWFDAAPAAAAAPMILAGLAQRKAAVWRPE